MSLYVAGGFASVRQRNCGDFACGDIDAGSYRKYMNDLWLSKDGGASWEVVTLGAPWRGRGGHSLVHFLGSLWLFNGQGGEEGQHPEHDVTYFADQWRLVNRFPPLSCARGLLHLWGYLVKSFFIFGVFVLFFFTLVRRACSLSLSPFCCCARGKM